MSSHLTQSQISDFLRGKVAGVKLLATDRHLLECNKCAERVSKAASGVAAVMEADSGGLNRHPDYVVIEGYVRESLSLKEREVAEEHFTICKDCRSEMEDLQLLQKELETERVTVPERRSEDSDRRRIPVWQILVPAVAFAGIVIGIVWLAAPESEVAEEVSSPTPSPEPTPQMSVPAAPSPTPLEEKVVVLAELSDASGQIVLEKGGSVSGVTGSKFQAAVRDAILNGRLIIGSDSREVRQGSGTLMGEANGVPFALRGPVGKVLESERPEFHWDAYDGAEHYRVEVYSPDYKLVAKSPDLTSTSWSPSSPLPRGIVLRWQVAAVTDGTEVISPVRPAPNAKLKIIDRESAEFLDTARRVNRGSHLVLGIAYARAGLLEEAEKEFRELIRMNPGSDIAKELLRQIRARR